MLPTVYPAVTAQARFLQLQTYHGLRYVGYYHNEGGASTLTMDTHVEQIDECCTDVPITLSCVITWGRFIHRTQCHGEFSRIRWLAFLLRPGIWAKYCDQRICVYVWVCLCPLRPTYLKTAFPNFTIFSVGIRVICRRGSISSDDSAIHFVGLFSV